MDPRIALLERRNGSLVRVAEARIERKNTHCTNRNDPPEAPGDDGRAPDFKLDLASYEVRAGSSAIGVRYSCFQSWPAADHGDELLYLLEPVGNELHQILEARIGFTRYERPTFDQTSGVGTLTATSLAGKAGYFDLTLHMKVTVENTDPRLYPDAPGSSTREEAQRFTWAGTRYRELGAEPH